eukprot:Skav229659  [mRNA]  locus=scaffold1030:54700:58092:- [translate_table: standard]
MFALGVVEPPLGPATPVTTCAATVVLRWMEVPPVPVERHGEPWMVNHGWLRANFTELLRDFERRPPPITFPVRRQGEPSSGQRGCWRWDGLVEEYRQLYLANVGEEKASPAGDVNSVT